AGLHAAPKLLLGRQKKMPIERVGVHLDFDPFTTASDDREHRGTCSNYPHVVLQLGCMFFGRSFFREIPGQHELSFEDCPVLLNAPIERCAHPLVNGMSDLSLHVLDDLTAVTFVPSPVEVLGYTAELDD